MPMSRRLICSLAAAFVLQACSSTSPTQVSNRVGIISSTQALPAARDTPKQTFIRLAHIDQEKNLCVPTSAAMVLDYFGDPKSPRELKVLSRGRNYDSRDPFDDFTNTFFRDFVAGMRRIGYNWQNKAYANDRLGFSSGLNDIRESLKARRPVLVDTALYTGHTVAVVGFDDVENRLYVIDPGIASPGYRSLTYAEFESIWNSSKVGFDKRGAILTRPK